VFDPFADFLTRPTTFSQSHRPVRRRTGRSVSRRNATSPATASNGMTYRARSIDRNRTPPPPPTAQTQGDDRKQRQVIIGMRTDVWVKIKPYTTYPPSTPSRTAPCPPQQETTDAAATTPAG